ncbi:MAG: hypothetical protein RJQ14_04155 [Marinoscillum sp.]
MSKFLLAVFFCLMAFLCFGQSTSETHAFKEDSIKKEQPKKAPLHFSYGIYGESFVRITPGFDTYRLSTSMGGGVSFEFITAGFAVHKLQSDIYRTLIFPNQYLFQSQHGAAFAGLRVVNTKVVHGEMRLNLGKGDVVWTRESNNEDFLRDKYDLFEPEVVISIVPIKYLQVMISSGYRKVKNLEISNANNDDLSGFTFGLGIKYGFFN